MKKIITITMISLLILTGCSFKSHSVKVGATAGAMTGVVYGTVFTALIASSGTDNSEAYMAILLGSALLSLFGFAVGGATGYVLDNASTQNKNDIEVIKQSMQYVK